MFLFLVYDSLIIIVIMTFAFKILNDKNVTGKTMTFYPCKFLVLILSFVFFYNFMQAFYNLFVNVTLSLLT